MSYEKERGPFIGNDPMLDSAKEPCKECAAIQIADPLRHFKGCSQRVEREDLELKNMIAEYHSRGDVILVLREQLRQALNREAVLNESLTSVQERCTQLFEECRALDNTIVFKGWKCRNPQCGVFNGEEKEIRTYCRACSWLKEPEAESTG